jgi:hypothetical protein
MSRRVDDDIGDHIIAFILWGKYVGNFEPAEIKGGRRRWRRLAWSLGFGVAAKQQNRPWRISTHQRVLELEVLICVHLFHDRRTARKAFPTRYKNSCLVNLVESKQASKQT